MLDYSHTQLMNHFKAFGYDLTRDGVCAGLAQMSIQAFLAGREEFKRFNERLELIASSSPFELRDRVRKAREAIAERSRKKRREDKLAATEIVIVDLTEEEELLTETEAFFGGVELYLYSARHHDFFSKPVPQPQVHEILPFMESTALVAHGGMRVADSFPGFYALDELVMYFHRFTRILLHSCPPCDFAMGLDSINHRISVLFDSTRGVWIMNDANKLPSVECVDEDELAAAVLAALARRMGEGDAATKVAFNTTVYATAKNEEQVKQIMQTVRQSNEYREAHAVTRLKVKERTEVMHVSLANIAAKFGHTMLLELIGSIKPGALVKGGSWGNTPLHTAVELNLAEVVNTLVDEVGSSETMNDNGQTPLCLAICERSMEAMAVLLAKKPGLASIAATDTGWLPLHVAAKKNNVEAIKLLVAKGANPRVEFAAGWSPVAVAADHGQLEALEALIAIDPAIDLEKPCNDGLTPLMLAAIQGHTKAVKWLMEQKINYNKKNVAGKSALHLAVEENRLAVVEALIHGGAVLDVEDNDGNTPLHLAAAQNKREIFDLLIRHHASKVKVNKAGKSPIHKDLIGADIAKASIALHLMLNKIEQLKRLLTARGDSLDALEQLKKVVLASYSQAAFSRFYPPVTPERGLTFVAAESDNMDALRLLCAEEKIDFEEKNGEGRVPLQSAVLYGSTKVVDHLLKEAKDPAQGLKPSFLAALYSAAENGYIDMLRKIVPVLSLGVLNGRGANNETALYAAVKNGHAQAAQLLIEAGVDVNSAAGSGWPPIHLTLEKNHFDLFKMLVEKADLTKEVGSTGMTAVALAAEFGRIECLRILLAKQPAVDIRKKSATGLTPLMLAIKNRHVEAALLLIEALEAKDLNEKNTEEKAALHLAIENNDLALVRALITKGAAVNLTGGSEAQTPIQLANMRHQVELVKLLRSNGADPRIEDSGSQSALSRGSPLGDATARFDELSAMVDGWMEELAKAQPSGVLPAAVSLEFKQLKQALDNDFNADYELFLKRYGASAYQYNDHLLIAFVAAAKGYGSILEAALPKINIHAQNQAGLSLSEVADYYHHPELVRILHEQEEKRGQQGPGGASAAGLFGVILVEGVIAVPPSAVVPKALAIEDAAYEALKKTILQEALRIEKELEAQLAFNPALHRKTLQYVEIRRKLAECDAAASKQADKYQYLKAQCEDKNSLLHHALHRQTSMGAEGVGSTGKNVLEKIAELDAQRARRDHKPSA